MNCEVRQSLRLPLFTSCIENVFRNKCFLNGAEDRTIGHGNPEEERDKPAEETSTFFERFLGKLSKSSVAAYGVFPDNAANANLLKNQFTFAAGIGIPTAHFGQNRSH